MEYRTNIKNGDKIFPLAFGCMRFPKDDAELLRQISHAIDKGVNYFDTAYIYPNSEERLGRALSGGLREKVKIATKLPPYFVNKYEDMDKIFEKQLARLKTDYIDYYMVHALSELSSWERLRGIGALEWIRAKKESGQIKNFGFSYHGGKQEYEKLIDSHDWDFSMIQYNYLDEHNQAGKSGLLYATERGIPVVIMEPMRGGMLAGRMPAEALKIFEASGTGRTPAQWAFRWIFDQREPMTVLSGMNTLEMIDENIKTAAETEPGRLTEEDRRMYAQVVKAITAKTHVNCTGCNYCMPCPAGVDIPLCFSCWNDKEIAGPLHSLTHYVLRSDKHNASLCTQCGKCEVRCPQRIAIRKALASAKKDLEGPFYKPLRFLVRKLMKL